MIKQLSIIALAATLVAGLIAVFTWPGEAQQRDLAAGQATTSVPVRVANNGARYDAGMRIIHVPQAGEDMNYPVTTESITDEEIDTAPKAMRKRTATPTSAPPQPRRVLPPPATGPKRSVLSAPPPLADGPTPIRPLPKWRSSEKFTVPAAPVVADPAPADAVTALPLTDTTLPADAAELPAIDDDTPPPTELTDRPN